MPTGTAIIDFGNSPICNTQASVAVTGQSTITASSKIEAYMMPVLLGGVNGHSEDEHMVENLKFTVPVSTIIAGVGFTIQAECTLGTANGQFTVNWVWV